MNLIEYLQSAKKSLFRFEYLQDFDILEEREAFEKYKNLGQFEVEDLMKDWWEFLESKHAEGVKTQRVKLVRNLPTKYAEWVLKIHEESIKHGDEIKVLPEEKLTPEIESLGDFWIIDDLMVLKMNYSSTGEYLWFETVENVGYYTGVKEYLLKESEPEMII